MSFSNDETAASSENISLNSASDDVTMTGEDQVSPSKPRILIGSQRHSDPYHPKPAIPVVGADGKPLDETPIPTAASFATTESETAKFGENKEIAESREKTYDLPPGNQERNEEDRFEKGSNKRKPRAATGSESAENGNTNFRKGKPILDLPPLKRHGVSVPVPTIRGKLADDLEEEFDAAFGDTEMDVLLTGAEPIAAETVLDSETKQKGKIISITRENVFVELGSREQGVVPLKQFKKEPKINDPLEVFVVKFLQDEGLYELTLPLSAADVSDWSQIEYGMLVEAKITAQNTGGLECEVNRLRGFIPASQVGLYRVEKLEDFIGQKLMCVVTECNPSSRNLVLSHRSLLEKEREEKRQQILQELEPGQIRDGVIRKLIDSGAFVDLGGVDGFIPISALAWGKIKHPRDVLQEGQPVKVKIQKMDEQTGRISLIYRDDASNPWLTVESMFPEKSVVRGKVSKIMDFGAFIELMPGVEGLVHISELAHKRVVRVSEILKEGEWVDVYVQSIDLPGKRISLSIKQLTAVPEPVKPEETQREEEPEVKPVPVKFKNQHKGPLKGGVGEKSDGDKFGLNF
ncbi:MAG: S1 RNA-binding domain-containing protein [Planctomycetaceae bacterium]|jgi:small subunit ribosomal protein S1|nr:S1 RNA-binding domain-containing protein [Planctomycetaceae bacterium]